MKKALFLLALSLSVLASAQDNDALSKHHLSLDFGSFRNRYAFAINDVEYSTPSLTSYHVRFTTRLRSYGTWFLYSKIAYDITPIAEVVFSENTRPVYFTAGIGADIRLRILNDSRSEAMSSAEPLISVAANGALGKFNYRIPFWTRFYSNGISFALLPQPAWQFNEHWSVFLRYEITYLATYSGSTHEWRRDGFVGVSYSW